MRPIDVPELVADISAVSEIGWKPVVSRDDTLRRVLTFWRNRE